MSGRAREERISFLSVFSVHSSSPFTYSNLQVNLLLILSTFPDFILSRLAGLERFSQGWLCWSSPKQKLVINQVGGHPSGRCLSDMAPDKQRRQQQSMISDVYVITDIFPAANGGAAPVGFDFLVTGDFLLY